MGLKEDIASMRPGHKNPGKRFTSALSAAVRNARFNEAGA